MFPTNQLIAVVYIQSGLLPGPTARTLHRLTSLLIYPSRMIWTPILRAKLVWILIIGLWFLQKKNRKITKGGVGWAPGKVISTTLTNWQKNKYLIKAMNNDIGLCALNSLIASMIFGGTPEELNREKILAIVKYIEASHFDDMEKDIGGHFIHLTLHVQPVQGMTMDKLREMFSSVTQKTGCIVVAVARPGHAFNLIYNCETKKFAVFDLNYIVDEMEDSGSTIIGEEGFDPHDEFSPVFLSEDSKTVSETVRNLCRIETVKSAFKHTENCTLSSTKILLFLNTFRHAMATKKRQRIVFLDLPVFEELIHQIDANINAEPRLDISLPPPSTMYIDDSNIFLYVSGLLKYDKEYNQPISEWNVSNVTNMCGLFAHLHNFNEDISRWNVCNVTNMSLMFGGATSFNCPLNSWNTSNVTDMHQMFADATSFNCPLNGWNTSNVTDMHQMFAGATSFNCPINLWNTSNVTDMHRMFAYASVFNSSVAGWNTSKVTNMEGMFYEAESFNCTINNWNVSNVTNMSGMFYNTSEFNSSLKNWKVSDNTNIKNMFSGSAFQFRANGWGVRRPLVANVNWEDNMISRKRQRTIDDESEDESDDESDDESLQSE